MKYAEDVEKLAKALRPLSDEQEANAAVALLLKHEKSDLSVFLVKRVENLGDPWSGQMAFPGGKRIEKDLDLKQTIVRETREETDIDLLDRCRFLGVLTAMRSRPRPDMKILPYVILVQYEPKIRLNKQELEDSFWIPTREVEEGKGHAKFDFGEAPAYTVRGRVVWGLTYRILESLFALF
jgi:8-oxo-dGTP pyrophosphatase MutT (NUDIX family)